MIKFAAILAMTFCLACSQRPPYAGSSNRQYPVVLPQYIESQEPASAIGIGNRIDGSQDNGANSPLSSGTVYGISGPTTTPPLDLPVDAHGDIELINRIKTWPREKQPFWFLNWQQIQEHRGDANRRAEPVVAQPNTRSFFAG